MNRLNILLNSPADYQDATKHAVLLTEDALKNKELTNALLKKQKDFRHILYQQVSKSLAPDNLRKVELTAKPGKQQNVTKS